MCTVLDAHDQLDPPVKHHTLCGIHELIVLQVHRVQGRRGGPCDVMETACQLAIIMPIIIMVRSWSIDYCIH